MTIIVLADEDGYEFPIGAYAGSHNTDAELFRYAEERAAEFVESGDFRPAGSFHQVRIERPET
jgi:hypothetical protein